MDFAGASATALHAVGRLLGLAALATLLVLALAAGAAHAQVSAPPWTPADATAHDHSPDGGDRDDHDGDWPGDGDDDRGYGEPVEAAPAPVTSTFVPGREARMRTDGKAAIPRGAPKRVRNLIAQYNRIVGKRYKWGGGHGKLVDSGYDCSGAVGYGLIKGGLLRTTMVSGAFARWGSAGPGRWVTVYANKGHVYVEVAGLRLDTSAVGDRGGRKGVRWRPAIGRRSGFKLRHPVGL